MFFEDDWLKKLCYKKMREGFFVSDLNYESTRENNNSGLTDVQAAGEKTKRKVDAKHGMKKN